MSLAWRYGGGASGNVARDIGGDKDLAGFWVFASRRRQGAGWEARCDYCSLAGGGRGPRSL